MCICLGRAHTFKPTTVELISRIGLSSLILDFGGGDRRLDLSGYVNLDIARYPGMTTVVGDGHVLPFKENTFDIVICEASIEHCKKPWIVVEELYRILKKGGHIYVDAAFMQPLHSYPNHYFNMTLSGIETLFDKFRKLKSGVQPYQMPSYTMVCLLSNYIRCLFPSIDNVTKDVEICDDKTFGKTESDWSQLSIRIYGIVHRILSILDRRIPPDKAQRMSAGVFFLGQKS